MRRLLALLVMVLVAVPAGAPAAPVSAATAPGIEGRITADSDSLGDATVQAIQSGAIIASDTTDSTGRYDLDLPAAGTYDVRVIPPPSAPFTGTVASGVVVDASIVTVLDIQLRLPLGTLAVTVRDGSGDVVPRARVSLRGAGFTVTSATTNSSGVARLVTKPGSYGLRIEAPSPWTADSLLPAGTVIDAPNGAVVSVAGEARTVQIPTATLTVATTRQSDGTPVTGASVSAKVVGAPVDLGGGLTGTARFATTPVATDAGTVTQTVIAATGVTLSVTAPTSDPFLLGATTTTDVPTSGAAVTVALPSTPVEPVTVRFLDAAGNRVAGATVRSTLGTATTDANGEATVLARSDVSTQLLVTKFSTDPLLPDAITFRRTIRPTSGTPVLIARALVGTVTVTVTRDLTTPLDEADVRVSAPAIVDPDGWVVQSPIVPKLTNAAGQTTVRLYPTGSSIAAFSASWGQLSGFTDAAIPDGPSSVTIDVELPDPPAPARTSVSLGGSSRAAGPRSLDSRCVRPRPGPALPRPTPRGASRSTIPPAPNRRASGCRVPTCTRGRTTSTRRSRCHCGSCFLTCSRRRRAVP